MGTYLGTTLHFTGPQIGWAYATTATGHRVAVLSWACSPTASFATRKAAGCAALVGGAIMWYVSTLTSFGRFFPVLILYACATCDRCR